MPLQRRRLAWTAVAVCIATAIGLSACRKHPAVKLPNPHTPVVDVLATAMVPPGAVLPALRGLRFGGVSALAYDRVHDELLGLSDDTENSRIFRMKMLEEPFRVVPTDMILLERAPDAPPKLDPEGLVLLPSGDLLVSSEGIGDATPRIPPAIVEYRHDGRFVRQLPVPAEFLPPASGPLVHGVPNNQAFEALTLSPDNRSLWTGVETALVQDGPVATAAHGSRTRLLEYREENGSFRPNREFAYDIDPLPPVPYGETSIAINGLVELLALDERDLISMERTYIEDRTNRGNSTIRIRLFHVVIDGTPIQPGVDSIADRTGITPVTKTLLFDLGGANNLPAGLAGLDNFEGIAAVPTRPPGRYTGVPALQRPRATAILVSDDNFSARQHTWFVKIGFEAPPLP